MPAVLPALSDHLRVYYRHPDSELVGRMYDRVILTCQWPSGDALRSLEDAWCEYARRSLLRAAARPGLLVTWTVTVTARQHRSLRPP